MPTAEDVVRAYFSALTERDTAAAAACWAPHGVDRLGSYELRGPEGVRAYFDELFTALPDWRFEVTGVFPGEDRVAAQWRATGTFAGGPLQGIEPTGARVQISGCDVFRVEDGLIVENDAYTDAMEFARQIGMLPPAESAQEQRLTQLFNVRTRVSRKLGGVREPVRVADGVWLVRGDIKAGMNVYFIEQPNGKLVMFDAGTKPMTSGIAAAAARLGGLERVVLGHSHADHRGTAPFLGVPVWCHVDDVAFAEMPDGRAHHRMDELPLRVRHLYKHVLYPRWDGGAVEIAGTLEEGDEVAGFEVVHTPGHAPGLITLFRRSDGVALSSDLVYLGDSITFAELDEPQVPGTWWNVDDAQACESVRKVAALEPKVVWLGHTDRSIDHDVRARLERAADLGPPGRG